MPSKSNTPGKVVDTWHYEKQDGTKIPVQLRIAKQQKSTGEPPFSTSSVRFVIELDDPPFKIEGTDCEVVRQAAWAKLDKKFEIKWEDYYQVRIRNEHAHYGQGQGFCLEYDTVYKGRTYEGKDLLRRFDRWESDRTWVVSDWPGDFVEEKGEVRALIPATKLNKKALEEFDKRIIALRKLLREFLSPKMIQKTLADLAGLKLLPPPAEGEDDNAEGD